jgi:hypothetical protein
MVRPRFRCEQGTGGECEKLIGKRIVVRGKVENRELDGFIKQTIRVVVASELEAVSSAAVNQDSVQETVHLDVQLDLESVILGGLPSQTSWTVMADGKTYHLEFDNSIPKEKPGILDGKKVIVTGTLKEGTTIHVTGLRAATDR